MKDANARISVIDAAERVDKDFMTYITYVQENQIKLNKRTAYLSRIDCYNINQRFLCQPESWEKPTMGQNAYVELDFFYYCSLRLGLLKVIKRSNSYEIEAGIRLEAYIKEKPETRYCLLLTLFWLEYMEKLEGYLSLPLLGDMLQKGKSGSLMTGYSNTDWWHCTYKYGQALKLLDVFGLAELIWLEKIKDMKVAEHCSMRVNDLGKYLAKRTKLSEIYNVEEEPMSYLWKNLCQSCEGNKEAEYFLYEEIEDKSGMVFYLNVSLADCIRKIKISGNYTLDDLHNFIQHVVDFDNDHMYCFTIGRGKFKKEYFHPFCEDSTYLADEVEIGELSLEKGSVFSYLFDFGDCWDFSIKVEKIIEEEFIGAELVEAIGSAPEQYDGSEW